MIHRNLLLPCNDLPFEVNPDKTPCRSSRWKPKITLPPTTSSLSSIPEDSSDEEPEGLLTFTPVEPETTPSNSTLAEEPVTTAEFPQETSAARPELTVPTEPESGTPTKEQPGYRPSDEWPTRQRRPPTLLTYDTLATPTFHHPAVPSSTSHKAGGVPLQVFVKICFYQLAHFLYYCVLFPLIWSWQRDVFMSRLYSCISKRCQYTESMFGFTLQVC